MVKVPKGYRSENVEDRRSRGSTQGRSSGSGSSLGGGLGGGGMSDLLGGMLGANATGGGLLGSLLGSGGLTSILGSILGGGGLGSLLGSAMGGGDSAASQLNDDDRRQADDQAEILVRAMINAAKSDGQIEQAEVDNIVGRLGEIDEHEAEFLRNEFRAPLDIEGFCRSVPRDMAQQAYAFSVMGMKLDTQREAQYLGAVAQGLGLDPNTCNAIHDKLGAPQIFR